MTGYVTLETLTTPIVPEPPASEGVGGFIAAEDNIEQNAPVDMPTIEPSAPPAENTTILEQQAEETQKVVEEANKDVVPVTNTVVITASNAAEEYLALNMVAGNTSFSIKAFPELQSWSTLKDVLLEVTYQNPMILGVSAYGYNYSTKMVTIEYKYTAEELKVCQAEIQAEGKRIIESIITADMNDAAKRRAIYDYLEANTVYDDAALEAAQKNNFQLPDNSFRDSFSTYGILVKKVGVCQSYAMAFDYLCSLADVNCVVVVGDIMGGLPHAWNKVEVSGEWLTIDVTNNEKSLGIKDFMYMNPDFIAEAMGYDENDEWYTQDDDNYHSSTAAWTKYKDCTIKSSAELKNFINAHAQPGEVELVVTYSSFTTNELLTALANAGVQELGESMVIDGYIWFEIVK